MLKSFNNTLEHAGMAKQIDAAKGIIATARSGGLTSTTTKGMVGLESLDVTQRQRLDNDAQSIEASITQRFGHELTQAQKDAGVIVTLASADPVAYSKVAMESITSIVDGVSDISDQSGGQYGSNSAAVPGIGMEYFSDHKVLDQHLGVSLTFNVQAARQDRFSEAFFPTITIDPSQCGMIIEIDKTMVFNSVRHALNSKDSVGYDLRNVLDAATDATVLEDDAVKFVPCRLEDNSNADNFIPAALYAPKGRVVGDYEVQTAPLAFAKNRKKLMELSAHPGLVKSGFLDESDEFDGRFAVSEVFFSIHKKGAPADETQIVKFNTLQWPLASFNKSPEGDGKDMTLNFRNNKFQVHKGTRDVTGAEVTALDELAASEYRLAFTSSIYANVNLVTGDEEIQQPNTNFLSLVDESNEVIGTDAGAGKILLESIEITPIGYSYAATRSNVNRRTKGKLVDTRTLRERAKIQLGSPITSRKPIGASDNSKALNSLITTVRQRNSNLAVTKLLNYSAALKDVYAAITDEFEMPSIEGPGRHYVGVWYEETTIRIPDIVATLDSQDITENLAQSILVTLREQIVRAYQESRFQPALEMISGNTNVKPKVTIGTDIIVANWIWQKGDVRTLGDQFEYELVSTTDSRFRGRIQWAFKVEDAGTNGFCPLNFGYHLWVPELITDTNLTRNDGTTNEITVQPRNAHFVCTPITGVVNIEGLSEFLTTKPYLRVRTESIAALAPTGPVTP